MQSLGKSQMLPPLWVRAGSWLFLIFLIMPILASPLVPEGGTVEMLGMSVKDVGPSASWAAALELLLFLSGLTALAILMRWKWAYDLGMAYASLSILVGALGLLANVGGVQDNLGDAAVQHLCLGEFLIHLSRHRDEWRGQASNSPLHPPSGPHVSSERDRLRRAARG